MTNGLGELLMILVLLKSTEPLKIEVYNGSSLINTYEDDTAVYDDKSYGIDYRLRGALIYPNPRNACSPVEKPSSNPSMFFAFVANYDNCVGRNDEFLFEADYKMMITQTGKKSKLKPSVDFPQAMVTQEFGTYLVDNIVALDANETVTSGLHLVVSENYMSFYEKLLLIFGIVLLCAIFLAVVIFFCTCCCRMGMYKWRTRGLSNWRIRQLPRRRYHKGKEDTETCSICLEEFQEREYLRVLPCDHVFHPKCVDEWLKNWNRVCPLCKIPISRSRRARERQPLISDEDSAESYGSIRSRPGDQNQENVGLSGLSDTIPASDSEQNRRNTASI